MDSALFLRLATSRDKEGILALAREGITYDKPEDVIKDTYTLEFFWDFRRKSVIVRKTGAENNR